MLDWASIIIDGVSTSEAAETKPSSAPCEPQDQGEESLLDRLGLRVEYVETLEAAAEAVASLTASSGVLGLDIETAPLPEFRSDKAAGLDPPRSSIRLIQVFGGGSTVYVFDVHALKGLGQLAPLWPMQFVAHNAIFELKHLLHAGANVRRIDCTMLQANLLRGELCGLAVLAEDVLGWEISKELQKSDWTVPELAAEQIEYAALDAVTVYRLFQEQKRELAGNGREESYQLLRDAQPAIARMELGGIWLDRGAHSQLVARWQAEFKKAEGSLREVLGPGVNPSSPPQLSAWLEAKLDDETLARWPRTKTGQLGTGAEALSGFRDLPIVKPLLAYKDLSKKLSTYGDKFAEHISPVTGRIHASFRLGGTKTGRLACSKPSIQNPPRDEDFRALFAAPPGRRLVVADYSQIELRVAALVSQDPAMLEAYENGEDLHRKTAAAIAGVAPGEVTKEQRQMAKAVNFGLLYGQGPTGLARSAKNSYDVDMTEDQAKLAQHAFFDAYPGLKSWQIRTARRAKKTMRVTTPGGRVRDFSKERKGYSYTQALNTPIQGGAAEVMLATLACLDKHLSGLDADLVNIVHDELVLEVAEECVGAVKKVVEHAMVEGMLKIFPAATTVGLVEASDGSDWAEAK